MWYFHSYREAWKAPHVKVRRLPNLAGRDRDRDSKEDYDTDRIIHQ